MGKPAITVLLAALQAALCVSSAAASPAAEANVRWLPPECAAVLDRPCPTRTTERPRHAGIGLYRRGYAAIEQGDLDGALKSLCEALASARGFDRGDVRWAETFDELGLLGFQRGDLDRAEALQGAPPRRRSCSPSARRPATFRPPRRIAAALSLRTYLGHLALVYDRQERVAEMRELEGAPYRILGMGYVPAPAILARLDWLISRYLLAEDMKAADWLSKLRRRLRAESSER